MKLNEGKKNSLVDVVFVSFDGVEALILGVLTTNLMNYTNKSEESGSLRCPARLGG